MLERLKGRTKFIEVAKVEDVMYAMRFNKTQVSKLLKVNRSTLSKLLENNQATIEVIRDEDSNIVDLKMTW